MRRLVLAFGLLLGLSCAAMPRPAEAVHITVDYQGTIYLPFGTRLASFDLPLSPTPDGFVSGSMFFFDPVPVDFFGVGIIDLYVAFFSDSTPNPFSGTGGIQIGGGGGAILASGPQLYSGPESAPTLLPGVYNVLFLDGALLTIAPEPASMTLLGAGLLGLGLARRRRA